MVASLSLGFLSLLASFYLFVVLLVAAPPGGHDSDLEPLVLFCRCFHLLRLLSVLPYFPFVLLIYFSYVHTRYITIINMYKCVFWHFGIFFSSGRGSFLVLSAPWHAGSPPGPRTEVWALAEVRGTCSGGSKSARGGIPST